MYIDLLFLLLLACFLLSRLWGMLGKGHSPKTSHKKNFSVVPREKVIVEKESRTQENFYPGFEESSFLSGVEKAFTRIKEALKTEDKKVLQKLVTSECLNDLLSQKKLEEKHDALCLLSVVVQKKMIQDGEAKIDVQINSQENYKDKIWSVEEVWTFKRSLASTNPNWIVSDVQVV